MQVIIPLAGKGTRLRPHTHLIPKPMLKVAGRPVMDWVMDRLDGLNVEELIFITGHLKEQVEAYTRQRYPVKSSYIEQKVQDGTAGAINLARPLIHGPAMIIFVDTVFEADLTLAERTQADGIIWAKEVEDFQRYGVVVTDSAGYMTKIVEKPSEPISKLANIGLYYMRNVDARLADQQGRVLPHRRLPAHDRPRLQDPHRRGGRLVRLRAAGDHAGDQRDPARAGGGTTPDGRPGRPPGRAGADRGGLCPGALHHRPERFGRDRVYHS
jgi:CTP:phosphocholine cytidylyltransferase-like protein